MRRAIATSIASVGRAKTHTAAVATRCLEILRAGAALEVCRAIMQSARDHNENMLTHQVPAPEHYDEDLDVPGFSPTRPEPQP
jgi:hypothetical protein